MFSIVESKIKLKLQSLFSHQITFFTQILVLDTRYCCIVHIKKLFKLLGYLLKNIQYDVCVILRNNVYLSSQKH